MSSQAPWARPPVSSPLRPTTVETTATNARVRARCFSPTRRMLLVRRAPCPNFPVHLSGAQKSLSRAKGPTTTPQILARPPGLGNRPPRPVQGVKMASMDLQMLPLTRPHRNLPPSPTCLSNQLPMSSLFDSRPAPPAARYNSQPPVGKRLSTPRESTWTRVRSRTIATPVRRVATLETRVGVRNSARRSRSGCWRRKKSLRSGRGGRRPRRTRWQLGPGEKRRPGEEKSGSSGRGWSRKGWKQRLRPTWKRRLEQSRPNWKQRLRQTRPTQKRRLEQSWPMRKRRLEQTGPTRKRRFPRSRLPPAPPLRPKARKRRSPSRRSPSPSNQVLMSPTLFPSQRPRLNPLPSRRSPSPRNRVLKFPTSLPSHGSRSNPLRRRSHPSLQLSPPPLPAPRCPLVRRGTLTRSTKKPLSTKRNARGVRRRRGERREKRRGNRGCWRKVPRPKSERARR
ncbi:hypothetical protein HDK64DRAFT_281811, partial [Phyllosticta capitalensis]